MNEDKVDFGGVLAAIFVTFVTGGLFLPVLIFILFCYLKKKKDQVSDAISTHVENNKLLNEKLKKELDGED